MLSDLPAADATNWAKDAFHEHSAHLRRYLMVRVGNAHDADDLAQEVFTRLLRVRDIELVRKPLAYLLGIASHVVHEFIQRRQHDRSVFDSNAVLDHTEKFDNHADQGLAEQMELRDELDRALTRLPPTHRLVVLLVKRDGLSYAEAARCAKLSVHTVEKYLVEARALLRVILMSGER